MKFDALFNKNLTAEHAEVAEIIYLFFSAFSANSAVNYYVFCSIRPAAFWAGGWADT